MLKLMGKIFFLNFTLKIFVYLNPFNMCFSCYYKFDYQRLLRIIFKRNVFVVGYGCGIKIFSGR